MVSHHHHHHIRRFVAIAHSLWPISRLHHPFDEMLKILVLFPKAMLLSLKRYAKFLRPALSDFNTAGKLRLISYVYVHDDDEEFAIPTINFP